MRIFAVTLIVLLALSIIFPLLYSGVVSDRDEGVFLLIAREVKDGAVLYKDYADNKPPGIFFMLIPVVMFAGTDILKIRLAAAFINLLTAIFIFLIGKKVANEKVGAGAAIMYLLIINGFTYIGFILKTETIANLFLCAGIYLLISIEQKEWRYVAAGVMFAFAGMIRQVSVYALLLAAYWIWTMELQKLRKFALLGAGVVLGLLPFIYYLVSNGILMDMLYYTTYGVSDSRNMNAMGTLSFNSLIGNLIFFFVSFEVLLLILLATCARESSVINQKLKKIIWAWFLLVALIGPFSVFINNFFIMMVAPPLLLLASVGLQEITQEFRSLNEGKPKKLWRYVRLCVVFLFFINVVVIYPETIKERSERGGIFENSITNGDIEFVKEVLETEGRPTASFYVITNEPEIYYMLETKSITRFPFVSPYAFIKGEERTFSEEITEKVKNARAEYIILNNKSSFLGQKSTRDVEENSNFRNLMIFVEQNYTKKWEKNEVFIYVRKDLLIN